MSLAGTCSCVFHSGLNNGEIPMFTFGDTVCRSLAVAICLSAAYVQSASGSTKGSFACPLQVTTPDHAQHHSKAQPESTGIVVHIAPLLRIQTTILCALHHLLHMRVCKLPSLCKQHDTSYSCVHCMPKHAFPLTSACASPYAIRMKALQK